MVLVSMISLYCCIFITNFRYFCKTPDNGAVLLISVFNEKEHCFNFYDFIILSYYCNIFSQNTIQMGQLQH